MSAPQPGPARTLRIVSAVLAGIAAVLAASVLFSPEFAAYVDSGERAAGVAAALWPARAAVIGGFLAAAAAAVADRTMRRAGTTVLLLMAAVGVGFLVLLLLGS